MALNGGANDAEIARGAQHVTVITPDFGETLLLRGCEVNCVAGAQIVGQSIAAAAAFQAALVTTGQALDAG